MQTLHLTGVDLAVDRRGPADAPAVLLIAGGGQSMDWWTPEFCDQLRDADLQVIRYDHRDCGGSSSSPPGHPEYTGDDLAADPLRILDALEIERAHVVGMSMGGGIAKALAVRAPQRLASVTLVESSPAGGAPGPLPPPLPVVAVTFTEPPPAVDWSDQAAVIDYRVDVERPYAAVGRFDEARVREIATREVRRTRTMESSMNNHFLASPAGDTDASSIALPALVIHSADDPMFPLPHGEALAAMIPGARLLRLDGVGHEVPPPSVWSEVIPAIRELVAGAS